jgi:hypothetical protein
MVMILKGAWHWKLGAKAIDDKVMHFCPISYSIFIDSTSEFYHPYKKCLGKTHFNKRKFCYTYQRSTSFLTRPEVFTPKITQEPP